MSRFFVQSLLSLVVGVSMAVGFAPNAVKIRQEVMASLRERVKVDLPFVGGVTTQGITGVKANTSVSALSQFKSLIKENFQADAKVKGSLTAQVNTNTNTSIGETVINDFLPQAAPDVSVDGSANVNNQTNALVDTPVVDLKLKNTIKSRLDLNLLP